MSECDSRELKVKISPAISCTSKVLLSDIPTQHMDSVLTNEASF